jgi:hypothetical protein
VCKFSSLRELTTKLNKSSQLSSSTQHVNKALPLTFAKKLAARVDAYAQSYLTPRKRPTDESTADRAKNQEIMTKHVQKYLTLIRDDGTQRFWHAKLDDKTFYL